MLKKIILLLSGVFIMLQFFRGAEPEVRANNSEDLIANEEVPLEVSTILKASCYDCHSMESTYPWYTYITPVSWFVFDHVREGRDELNFSNWASMEKRRQLHKLKELREEVYKDEMPLSSYTIIHRDANLTSEQRKLINDWASNLASEIQIRD